MPKIPQVITSENIGQLQVLYSIEDNSGFCWSKTGKMLSTFDNGDYKIFSHNKNSMILKKAQQFKEIIPAFDTIMMLSDMDSILFVHQRRLHLYSLKKNQVVRTLEDYLIDEYHPHIWISSSRRYVGIKGDNTSLIWDLSNDKRMEFSGSRHFAFSEDDTLTAVLGQGILEIKTLKDLVTIQRFPLKMLLVLDIKFSPDNRYVAACGETFLNYIASHSSHDKNIQLSEPILDFWKGGDISERMCKKYSEEPVRLFDIEKNLEYRYRDECEYDAGSITFNKDSSLLLAGKFDCWSTDNPIVIWDIKRNSKAGVFRRSHHSGGATPIRKLEFNKEGTLLAANNGYVRQIDVMGVI